MRRLKLLPICLNGLLVSIALVLWAPVAAADSFAVALIDPRPASGNESWLGVSWLDYRPAPGSRSDRDTLLPMIESFGASGWFLSTEAGAGWNFSADPHWQYGLRLTPQLPRFAANTRLPAAIGDIGLRIEHGVFVTWDPADFFALSAGLRHGSGLHGDGLLADSGFAIGAPVVPRTTAALVVGTSWANDTYQQDYFGVNAGGATYRPAAGWAMATADLVLQGNPTRALQLTLDLGRLRYLGGAAASPLLEQKSERSFLAGIEFRF